MKKKIIIIVTAIFSFFVITIIGLIVFYNVSINSYDKSIDKNDHKNDITIVLKQGITSKEIVNVLHNGGLVKNKYVGYIYLKLNKDIVLQAGTYKFNKGMSLKEIIADIAEGKVVDNSIAVTFVEGIKITAFDPDPAGNIIKKDIKINSFANTISKNFPYKEEDIINLICDKEYLAKLIAKYWFLTDDILNDKLYYALEGYLYPDTYHFNADDKLETIIEKMLDETGKKLQPYKEDIENSDYSVHELLTMASIIELEGANSNDRNGVAGVFYNRLASNWSLGSDVTTYYASKVELADRDLYQKEIEAFNNYNTRNANMAGKLPIGPICSPSIKSIDAALKPTEHDYYFFVADKNGKTYFTKTNAEHNQKIAELKRQGLWYEYK